MNWSALKRVAAPAEAPLTEGEVRSHLRVDDGEAVAGLIAEAVAAVEGPRGIGIVLVEQTWRYSLAAFEPVIQLPLGPVRSIEAVEYVDTAGTLRTIDPADYQLDADSDPETLSPAFGVAWPAARHQPGSVKIRYKAGFGGAADVPADLKSALKLIIGQLYEDRETAVIPPGVLAVFSRYRAGLFV